ncbi:Mam3p Ecym_5242 [Eremothecium cymbalariae DBVPG|uniref:CNNM transmembrane domain-containing protein n=1 Tax=Eremothecium cymbalariae (strain CBS 270.75 / DBVPG 7215 / KCTC 17166 / NRRL Y-17582) TaxID=931890 RepID=I6ND67_ERECY|nr:hypothetical protein Ecym_5242 [Eremothecium cymbalariae DBVPG\
MRRTQYGVRGRAYASLAVLGRIPSLAALPVSRLVFRNGGNSGGGSRMTDMVVSGALGGRSGLGSAGAEGESFYTFMAVSVLLVLLGGVFAGLTLGLMGQDEIYLKVISTSGSKAEQKHAQRVLRLLGRGKHWVLVTLLLSNVITNETLPIVLDRCIGGGWQAVVMSTALIVVFGEIIPQSLCVRYGLEVGAWFSPFVLSLMYLMYPMAYPIALLLDYLLGEDHGTVYKKSGLKTLVTLHKTMGVERLTQDEVTIISAVLDLKDKQVQEIMTPIENVFTISADKILDEKAVEELFNSGFSRVPIYLPGQPTNFIGMLLVRVLISYDPADALPVSHFPLATLPETSPKTSCLNILNYFQEGKSHMCVVSKDPGSSSGALGVLTLEDVIEELIGEEIVDESDVFVNIHQRIMRKQPGPLSKRHITSYLHSLYTSSSRASAAAAAAAAAATDSGPGSGLESARGALVIGGGDSAVSAKSTTSITKEQQQQQQPQQSSLPMVNNEIRIPVTDIIQPLNPAANPLNINNPYVTIKRQSSQLQKSMSSPRPSVSNDVSKQQGRQEQERRQDATLEAQQSVTMPFRNGSSSLHQDYGTTDNKSSHGFTMPSMTTKLVKEHSMQSDKAFKHTVETGETSYVVSTVLSDPENNSNMATSPSQLPLEKLSPVSPYSEKDPLYRNVIASSYKSTKNGIVESVITVQGVHKTIIEPAQDWDDSNAARKLPNSTHSESTSSSFSPDRNRTKSVTRSPKFPAVSNLTARN